jgi:hypothetical protein
MLEHPWQNRLGEIIHILYKNREVKGYTREKERHILLQQNNHPTVPKIRHSETKDLPTSYKEIRWKERNKIDIRRERKRKGRNRHELV